MLNAQQLSAAALRWLEYASPGADVWTVPALRAGDGPYHLLVAHDGARTPHGVRMALEIFAGVPVPYLCRATGKVLTGRVSLHVVPALVYAEITNLQWFGQIGMVDHDLEPAPFDIPPTEADMAQVFISALSARPALGSSSGGLPLAVRHACNTLGWRTVAALVASMDERTRGTSSDVAAVLFALTSHPSGEH